MSTPSLTQLIDRLDHLLHATRGMVRAIDPDPVFTEDDRINLYRLGMLLLEQQERCLQELTHLHAAADDCAAGARRRGR